VQVKIPVPWVHLVSESVIVESFEAGDSVTRYMAEPSELNGPIVAKGIDIYLKMLLHDNFVHSDLHPGAFACLPPVYVMSDS
jgi:aarF domain-containing kinase